jgi:hypothetical protein
MRRRGLEGWWFGSLLVLWSFGLPHSEEKVGEDT